MTNFKVGDKFILKESDYYIELIGCEFEIIDINFDRSYPIKAVNNGIAINIEYSFSEEHDTLEKILQDPIKLLFNHLKNI